MYCTGWVTEQVNYVRNATHGAGYVIQTSCFKSPNLTPKNLCFDITSHPFILQLRAVKWNVCMANYIKRPNRISKHLCFGCILIKMSSSPFIVCVGPFILNLVTIKKYCASFALQKSMSIEPCGFIPCYLCRFCSLKLSDPIDFYYIA